MRCQGGRRDLAPGHPGLAPGEVIVYALAEPRERGTGAVVRRWGRWFRLSFRCGTTPDGLGILAFEHTLGAEIPGWEVNKLDRGDRGARLATP